MNTLSIPVVAMASISFYVGIYHLVIYIRRRRNREDLTFALLCFAIVLYDAFSTGLYNATSVAEGAGWQRGQFIALAFFVPAFLWFVSDYTQQKPDAGVYLFSAFYFVALLVQLFDRSSLTFPIDQPSIKHITLPYIQPITYYEAALGPLTTVESLTGVVASTYILILSIRYFRRGYKREAMPLIIAIGLMYSAAIHDTLVSNDVYHFIYLMEYAYLAIILMMTYSLSSTVVEAAIAKEELRKSEEWFRSLVETTSDWVWEVNAKGVYTYASPRVRELLGYEPEEILGRTPFEIMPAEEAERMTAVFQSIMHQKKPFENLENIARCKDGQLIVLETSGVPFLDDYGALAGYRGIDRDITERKRAEQALQAKTEELDRYFTSSLDLLCIADTDGYFRRLNPEWETTLGYGIAELEGRQFLEFVHPEDMEATRIAISRLAAQQQVLNFENRYRRKDGSYRWIEWRSYPVGKAVYAVARDITKRKQVEEALRESEERLRQIASSLRETIWLRDVQTRQVLYVNPAFEELTGWTCKSFYENPNVLIDAIHPDDKEGVIKALDQRFEGVSFAQEHRIVHRDGRVRWVLSRIFPVRNEAGEVYRWTSILEDITERKQAETEREMLIANLENKNTELERFTYTVSHDLKAPLITIRGFLGFVEQDAQSGDLKRLKEDIQRIVAATDKMQRLLNDLLELSRIGRLMNMPQNIPFENLIRDAIKLMEGRLQERNVEIKIQENLPVMFGDAQRLSEVMQNLLDNAIKFMGEQAQPIIEIGASGEENGAPILYVRDNGIGIAPEHHERIFGLFNKLDPKAEGTGIGLAIVKRIIEVHGGRIWVESEEGKGATFYFTLGKGTQAPGAEAATSSKV